MNYRVVHSQRSWFDIQRNANWWATHHNEEEADEWMVGILDAIDTLADHPQRCPLAPENHKVPHELRELHYGVGSHPTIALSSRSSKMTFAC